MICEGVISRGSKLILAAQEREIGLVLGSRYLAKTILWYGLVFVWFGPVTVRYFSFVTITIFEINLFH